MLEVKNLSVVIDNKKILQDLNLKIPSGEIHILMGANGSGKSTLLKTIAGHPSCDVQGGQIHCEVDLKTKDLLSLEPYERSRDGVFLSFQDPVSLEGVAAETFYKTIYEQACKHQGAEIPSEDRLKKLFAKNMEKLGLSSDMALRFMNVGFSGGEKKRNEIFQMLLLDPRLVMLDEIDSGLDLDAIKVISGVIKSQKSSRKSFLVVTHYRKMLEELNPDRVHILSSGKIARSGDISLLNEVEKKGYQFFHERES